MVDFRAPIFLKVCGIRKTLRMKSQFDSWHMFLFAFLMAALFLNTQAAERLRVMVETDAGGDPDDEQSLVRFLLYSNEWD
ncbi:MAG TPA: nucleoside hydrolase-like domain-containing protein, partial [Candidatus Kapabacteria bacterium]|nr:nucleoside hydrolase-like domain-containing protein [Candidatus Kapabacteria bacterium]